MPDTPGTLPADHVPVVELAKLAGMAPTYYYVLARQGRAPKSVGRRGILLSEATAWLKARASRKVKKAKMIERLRSVYEAAKDGSA